MIRLLPLPSVVALLLFAQAACGSDPTTDPSPTRSGASAVPNDGQPRTRLAARAAAAKDLRQAAQYVLKTTGRPDRTISIQRAIDGSWRVDVPGGAYGGAVDIALVFTGGMLHQCALPTGAEPRSGCVKLDGGLPRTSDPKISHLITDWLNLFTDLHQALSVSVLPQPIEGATGDCFAIESSAVSLQMPLDAGIYCYEPDGTLSAAKFSVGTMLLAGRPAPAPPTLALPGPVVAGAPLPLAAPPRPPATPSPQKSP